MKFDKIFKSITGVSCPIFGLQWTPPPIESDEAKNVISYLENKRVLYNSASMEDANHCVLSVIEIRNELTNRIQILSSTSHLAKSLKSMRQACATFCDNIGHPEYKTYEIPVQKSILDRELVRLRNKCGLSLAKISIGYGVDVDDNLASIMPFNLDSY